MARTGRPRVGTVRTVRLSDGHWAALLARAAQIGIDRSELIRRYVAAGLRDDAHRYWEVPADEAAGTIELYRGDCPDAEGMPLEEWLQDHSLDDAAWEWLRGQGLDVDNPEMWALYVPTGEGALNRFFSCLPVGTHRQVAGEGCLQCGRPGPSGEFCDACLGAGAAEEVTTEE